MAAQAGGGYEAHAAGLDEMARKLGQFGDDLSSAVPEQDENDAAAFGDLHAAWGRFMQEWFDAAGGLDDDFADLAGKLRASSGTYRNAEQRAAALLRALAAGDS